mgnify:CR=1 FL=1
MDFDSAQPQVDVNAQPKAEPENVESEGTPAEPETEQQSDVSTDQYKLKIKYNGAEEELDEENARTLAQKGRNYDKIFGQLQSTNEELETLKNSRALKFFVDMAAEMGRTPDEAAEYFARQRQTAKDRELAKKLNKPVEVVTLERESSEKVSQLETKVRDLETAEQRRIRHAAEKAEFSQAYPDVDVATLPEDILAAWIDNGKNLLEAYRLSRLGEYEQTIKTLNERIAGMEQKGDAERINSENAATAPGKLGGGDAPEQPLTQEAIDKMTPEELDRNHKKIWAFLTGQKT